MRKPICYFLVGLPGSGKSTWSQNILNKFPDTVLISSDQYIERAAEKAGKSYGDVFQNEIKAATAKMNSALSSAVAEHKDIIWDQTNLTAKGRANKLAKLEGYDVVAVCFEIPREELDARRAKRKGENGKDVPDHIIANMAAQYERPKAGEGFSEIRIVLG